MTRPFVLSRQAGRSLIELMVALAIGLVIMGSVLLISVSSVGTGDKQNAVARLNEDAAIIGNILNAHLRVAGYSAIRSPIQPAINSAPPPSSNYVGPPVRGCENGINNPTEDDWNLVTCRAGVNTLPDGFAVMYEATPDNTMPTAGNTPTDCLGNALPLVASARVGEPQYTLAVNRFYVDDNVQTGNRALYCDGNGGAGLPQPLVDNVEDMQITYGVAAVPTAADVNVPQTPFFEPVQFLRADQVDALPPFPAGAPPIDNWQRVVSMRICLLMRSDDNALDVRNTPYFDCQGVQRTQNDRRLYRTVNITSAFKNRVPPCSDAIAAPTGARANPSRCYY